MAVSAPHRSMRPGQDESRLRVIERTQILPLRCCVAYFTSALGRCHSLVELSFVRIGVACRARETRKVIRRGLSWRRTLMAFGTRHRFVTARQFESQFLVLRQSER